MRIGRTDVITAVTLYLFAAAVRIVAIASVHFPANEGSAYYVTVARNMVEGRGLVIDAMWSYATPPLTLPRPAFELWQPMASFIAALPMSLLGTSFASAQLGGVLLGALVAPLAWVIGSQAARALRLEPRRAAAVAVGSGVLVAILGPFLTATAVPDSTIPFLIFGIAACILMPRALVSGGYGLALGAILGLAYLSRLEALYLALTFLFLTRGRIRVLLPVVLGGGLTVLPWLIRNTLTFGTPFTGQAFENLLFTRREDVFAYTVRPDVETFLAQGADGIVANVIRGLAHGLVDVLLVPGAPLAPIGLICAFFLLRRAELRPTALWALLVSGLLIYLADNALFPVATLWGTFLHSSGPLLVGLTVAAVLGVDAIVSRIRELRGWQRSNAWLAPAGLAAVTLLLAFVQLRILAVLSSTLEERYDSLARVAIVVEASGPIITEHPILLSDALDRPALALPEESVAAVVQLARDLGAEAVLMVDRLGRYPVGFRTAEGAACMTERTLGPGAPVGASLFVIRRDCLYSAFDGRDDHAEEPTGAP
jgi:hypothetical protein